MPAAARFLIERFGHYTAGMGLPTAAELARPQQDRLLNH